VIKPVHVANRWSVSPGHGPSVFIALDGVIWISIDGISGLESLELGSIIHPNTIEIRVNVAPGVGARIIPKLGHIREHSGVSLSNTLPLVAVPVCDIARAPPRRSPLAQDIYNFLNISLVINVPTSPKSVLVCDSAGLGGVIAHLYK
jgi:hypothetical protein